MSIKIDAEGNLWLERGSVMKPVMCKKDRYRQCGDDCVAFGTPEVVFDEDCAQPFQASVCICDDDVWSIDYDRFTDERKGGLKPKKAAVDLAVRLKKDREEQEQEEIEEESNQTQENENEEEGILEPAAEEGQPKVEGQETVNFVQDHCDEEGEAKTGDREGAEQAGGGTAG